MDLEKNNKVKNPILYNKNITLTNLLRLRLSLEALNISDIESDLDIAIEDKIKEIKKNKSDDNLCCLFLGKAFRIDLQEDNKNYIIYVLLTSIINGVPKEGISIQYEKKKTNFSVVKVGFVNLNKLDIRYYSNGSYYLCYDTIKAKSIDTNKFYRLYNYTRTINDELNQLL